MRYRLRPLQLSLFSPRFVCCRSRSIRASLRPATPLSGRVPQIASLSLGRTRGSLQRGCRGNGPLCLCVPAARAVWHRRTESHMVPDTAKSAPWSAAEGVQDSLVCDGHFEHLVQLAMVSKPTTWYAIHRLAPTLHGAIVAAHGCSGSSASQPKRAEGPPRQRPSRSACRGPFPLGRPCHVPQSRTLSLRPLLELSFALCTKPNLPSVKIFPTRHRPSKSLFGSCFCLPLLPSLHLSSKALCTVVKKSPLRLHTASAAPF